MLRVLPFILYVALSVYCIADAVQHPQEEPYGLPRWAWVLIILFFPYIGAGVWLYLKFSRPTPQGPRQRGPVAPDDDPEYLSWLRDQERRRKRGSGD